jgi:hypothetical protein
MKSQKRAFLALFSAFLAILSYTSATVTKTQVSGRSVAATTTPTTTSTKAPGAGFGKELKYLPPPYTPEL